MKYMIEDTYNGYRLSMLDYSGVARHHFDEVGGHGPIEGLHDQASKLWLEQRAAEFAEFRRRQRAQ